MTNILDNNFKIIAYRGGTEYFPENSIEAIDESLKSNPDTIIEIDLQFTKDKVVIVFHDFQLENLTNGKGKICDFTISELKKLFLKNYSGTVCETSKIPTLDEVFKKFKDQYFVLDLHENNKALFDKVIEVVEKHNFQDRVALVSIADGATNEFQKLKPNWTFLASPKETKKIIFASKLLLHRFVRTTSNIMFVPEKLGGMNILNKRVIHELHRRNIKVWSCNNFKPYENVNTLTDLKRLKELGIDGVYTNDPKKISENK